jgi:hypothetical protein
MEKPYSDLVTHAERAVSTVKDPELRRVAFERVLDDLISSAADARPRPATVRTAAQPARRQPAGKANVKRGGPQGYVDELVGEGFFAEPRTISEVRRELTNRGHHIPVTSLSGPLQKLCQQRLLRRQKIDREGKKKTFAYSNW